MDRRGIQLEVIRMANITMIPIGELEHHPENVRKDMGDLTELTESIRKNGVLQNLTVVADLDRAKYLVVIGNRRLEAAKAAGLVELPCAISDMDHKDQIAAMMQENMHRENLTVYEQACGFQLMMDLGFTKDQIIEKTGVSDTTVRRRLKMAELDLKQLKKACEAKDTERQITMRDFDRLAQIESVKERNKLLKEIGDSGFNWQLNRALQLQKCNAVRKDVKKLLKDAEVEQLPKDKRYSGEYERLWNDTVKLYEWEPGKKLIPKSKEPLFFNMDDDSVEFFIKAKKKSTGPQKSKEQIEQERKLAEAWKKIDQDTKTAAELRKEFAFKMTVNPKNAPVMMTFMARAVVLHAMAYSSARDQLKELLEIPDNVSWENRLPKTQEQLHKFEITDMAKIIILIFEGDRLESYVDGVKSREFPKYKPNVILDECYEWLSAYGYHLSEQERQLMTGTHPCFGEPKEE